MKVVILILVIIANIGMAIYNHPNQIALINAYVAGIFSVLAIDAMIKEQP